VKKNLKIIKNNKENNLVIYQAKSGAIEFRGDFSRETVWATQSQIIELFSVDQSVVSRHIKNIFKDNEVDEKSNMQKMHIANSDKPIAYYSLDVILAVGYRTNSARAISFRKWSTKILHDYLMKGYTLNKKVILKNYDQFLKNVAEIQSLLPEHIILDPKKILDLVKEYSTTWSNLDAYDRDILMKTGTTKKKIKLAGSELLQAIFGLKKDLIKKSEATDIFATERDPGSIEGIVGNVMQAFGGNDVYGTLEEKAGHLLYFMVKNHPFMDGNKRSGAFAFIWFLRKNGVRGARNINPAGLVAMTLLIAESDPKHKDKMVALVVELLRVNKK
jgi:prophage maintenance system killer protein